MGTGIEREGDQRYRVRNADGSDSRRMTWSNPAQFELIDRYAPVNSFVILHVPIAVGVGVDIDVVGKLGMNRRIKVDMMWNIDQVSS